MHKNLPLLLAVLAAGAAGCASAGATTTRQHGETASFKARNAFTVTPPAGAKTVRCWFAMPQTEEDQVVSTVNITAPGDAFDLVQDDHGNWFVYVEAKGDDLKPFEVSEDFEVTRWEVRTHPDPAKTRPLTAEEKTQFAAYLAPNANIPVNEEYRRRTPSPRPAGSTTGR